MNTYAMTDLSARLRKLRMSRADFQVWLGVSPRSVGGWCSGEYPVPQHVTVLLDLADLLVDARPGWGPPGSKR